MAEIGFVVSVPALVSAQMGNFIDQSFQLEQLVAKDLGLRPQDVRCLQIGKTDNVLVLQAADPATFTAPAVPSDRTSARKVKTQSATIAGAAAGDHTVSGIKATNTLIAVVHVDDATHAGTDKTSEYTALAGKINNTGGTSSASAHVVVSWI